MIKGLQELRQVNVAARVGYPQLTREDCLSQEDSTVKRLEYLEGNFRRHGSCACSTKALPLVVSHPKPGSVVKQSCIMR